MFGFLFLAFLVVPIIELYVFVQVADALGFGTTVFWIVAVSVIGAWLVKREGMSALRRANHKVAQGEVPTDELVNGIMILFAGALMLTPGFLTDIVGVLLLFPPTRALLRGTMRSRFADGPVVIGFGTGPTMGGAPFGEYGRPRDPGAGDIWDATSWEEPDDPDRPALG